MGNGLVISAVFLVVGLVSLVRAAALVSAPMGYAVFGAACVSLAFWPMIRSRWL